MRMQLCVGLAAGLWLSAVPAAPAQPPAGGETTQPKPQRISTMSILELRNSYAQWRIARDATTSLLADAEGKTDYARKAPPAAIAHVTVGGKEYAATAATRQGANVRLDFGNSGAKAVVKFSSEADYFLVEVVSLDGQGVDKFTFLDIPLTLKGEADEPFAACALALNLKTHVAALPMAVDHLTASCYPRFGFAGAKAAVLACPADRFRAVMQDAVAHSKDLPHFEAQIGAGAGQGKAAWNAAPPPMRLNLGGPWALDAPQTRGSYLFDFGDCTEKTVDEWIALIKTLGFTQIDFHGGNSFRFGDLRPNPETYPNGRDSFKAVIDKLHAAGISVGLHTYAHFIDKKTAWVTPKADPRLGCDATFTLAHALPADATTVPVVESTEKMSTQTAFFIRNSVTLRIDGELINFAGVSKQPPFGFTQCVRGAYGTAPAAHDKGAKACHLTECFGLFAPDGDSTLLDELADATADFYNYCGFDMMYLDALDGGDVLGGPANEWHYGAKFVYELMNRVKKPPLLEMSTFYHGLWCVRSRIGAWDFPTRGRKRFIDLHCRSNAAGRGMFLRGTLGWWTLADGARAGEHQYLDDVEYLCARCIGHDVGFALMGIKPADLAGNERLRRWAKVIGVYENLRHGGTVSESAKAALRTEGREFTLAEDAGAAKLHEAAYPRAMTRIEGNAAGVHVNNPFAAQELRVRLELLKSAAAYDSPQAKTIVDFRDAGEFAVTPIKPGYGIDHAFRKGQESSRTSAESVTAKLTPSADGFEAGGASGHIVATNASRTPLGAWALLGSKSCAVPAGHGLGTWVRGDGSGSLIDIELAGDASTASRCRKNFYVVLDFEGWRYFELVEPQTARLLDFEWPGRPMVGGIYAIYRESSEADDQLSLFINAVPSGRGVSCNIGPIKALPLTETTIRNPSISISGKTVTFPVEMRSGQYLELRGPNDCLLYDIEGKVLRHVTPAGTIPDIAGGDNKVEVAAENPTPHTALRIAVTALLKGAPIR